MTKQSKDQMHPFLSKERSDVDKINDLWDIPSAGQGFLSQVVYIAGRLHLDLHQ